MGLELLSRVWFGVLYIGANDPRGLNCESLLIFQITNPYKFIQPFINIDFDYKLSINLILQKCLQDKKS